MHIFYIIQKKLKHENSLSKIMLMEEKFWVVTKSSGTASPPSPKRKRAEKEQIRKEEEVKVGKDGR
jgi:hypothetical protein